jgi:hypothetical protein
VQIHYEIFRRIGAKGGWTLHEVLPSRDRAIQTAQALMASEKATGVKVVKETYNEDSGDYLSLKIFEEGHNQVKIEQNAEDAPHALPCFKPDDLYSYHARTTMARLLTDFLARNKITITELIHRADMLEKLEATGTVYQHAIQKVAVAQASSTTTPVQQIVKSLNDLTTKAFHRVYRDQRNGVFPDPAPEQFAELAASLAAQGNASYVFNGALARHLRDAKNWDEKVLRLLAIMRQAPAEGEARKLVLSSVDAIMSEILSGSAALHELIGPVENLAQALSHLIELFQGKAQEGGHAGLKALAARFAADELPEARTAIAGRIVAEFKSPKRLHPDVMVEELKSLRRLANKVVMGVGKYLSHEDLIAAFTLRSKRMVTPEALGPYVAEATVEDKIDRLLFVEENVIGAENKRQLSTFVTPVLQSAAFENYFQNPKLPILQRLQRLTGLQARVLRSSFVDETKSEIAEKLDKLGCDMAARAKLFETLDAKSPSHVEKATTLLKLTMGGFLTEGRLSGQAREIILNHLATPGFLAGYFATLPKVNGAADTDGAMKELMDNLGKIGITAETGLKTIAA